MLSTAQVEIRIGRLLSTTIIIHKFNLAAETRTNVCRVNGLGVNVMIIIIVVIVFG